MRALSAWAASSDAGDRVHDPVVDGELALELDKCRRCRCVQAQFSQHPSKHARFHTKKITLPSRKTVERLPRSDGPDAPPAEAPSTSGRSVSAGSSSARSATLIGCTRWTGTRSTSAIGASMCAAPTAAGWEADVFAQDEVERYDDLLNAGTDAALSTSSSASRGRTWPITLSASSARSRTTASCRSTFRHGGTQGSPVGPLLKGCPALRSPRSGEERGLRLRYRRCVKHGGTQGSPAGLLKGRRRVRRAQAKSAVFAFATIVACTSVAKLLVFAVGARSRAPQGGRAGSGVRDA